MLKFENLGNNPDAENFKTEVRLILQKIFREPQKAIVFVANIERVNEDIKAELGRRGYVYNRANLTFDPVRKEAQGYVCAVRGPAGDSDTLDRWKNGGMVARFVVPSKDRILTAFEGVAA